MTSTKTVRTALLVSLAVGAGACASGGGGGGGSPPISPPPPPPPLSGPAGAFFANDCAAKPQAIACSPSQVTLRGPTVFYRDVTGSRGGRDEAFPHVTENPAGGGVLTLSPGQIGVAGDEDFRSSHPYDGGTTTPGLEWSFLVTPQESTSFGFPTVRKDCPTGICSGGMIVVNAATAESGKLDYLVPLLKYSSAGNGQAIDWVFGAYGLETSFTPALRTGTATFAGSAFGLLKQGGSRWDVGGRLWMQANFATGVVSGAAHDFIATSSLPAGPLPGSPDFNFAAQMSSTDGRFNGPAWGRPGGLGMSGVVDGTFFGASGQSPEEVGLSFLLLGDSGRQFLGIGVGGRNDAAPAPAGLGATPPAATPLPPPPNVTCVQQTCLGGPTQFSGPSVRVDLAAGTTDVVAANINNARSGVTVTVAPEPPGLVVNQSNPGATYTIRYNINGTVIENTLVRPVSVSDGLGSYLDVQSTTGLGNGFRSQVRVYDVSTALSGSLDFVQLIATDRSTEFAYVVYGRQSTAAEMPTTGSATFAGGSRGMYRAADGTLLDTASDVSMAANFATGAVSGAATNFQLASGNTAVTRPELLDFAFNGSISAGTSMFSGAAASVAGGLGLTGNVEGAFFGAPAAPPSEAGFTYLLGTPGSGAVMAGGAALGRQP